VYARGPDERLGLKIPALDKNSAQACFVCVAHRTSVFVQRWWLLLLVVAAALVLFVVPFLLFGIGSTK
jgi:hypothetical protein